MAVDGERRSDEGEPGGSGPDPAMNERILGEGHHREAYRVIVDGRVVTLHDRTPTGRQVRQAAGAAPASDFILILVADRETRSVALDETLDLQEIDRPRFRLFNNDRIYTFTLDERGFEWGAESIAAAELWEYAEVPDEFEIVLEKDGGVVIPEDGSVPLGGHSSERLITRPRPAKDITIIVNGRPRKVKGPNVSFDEVVALAFPNPPTGEGVQFTVQYTRGPSHRPTGTLIEG